MNSKWIIFCCLFVSLSVLAQDDVVSLRLMTYNICHGEGLDNVIDLDRQANIIRDAMPDIVGLQEVDSCVKRSGYVHQVGILAKSLGMYSTFGPAIPLTKGKYGVAILSKEKPLSYHNIPLPGKEARTLLVCEFQEYVFATTHLDLEESNRLSSLNIILEEAARWDKPFFICGDWNDLPTSTLITKMRRNFSFLNSITNVSSNYTFRADNPSKIIDYIASYGRVVNSVQKRQVINEPNASDHRPVLVEIRMDRYTTRVPSISKDSNQQSIYNLTGQRAECSRRGLYIINGKKVLFE